jgi:hypothetical protein
MLPTSGGAAVPGGRGRTALPAGVARELGTSPQDKLLRAVATAAAYGAPQHRLHLSKRTAVKASALSASVRAVGAGRSLVVWLGVVVLVIAAVGAGAAALRARRAR